MAARCRLVAALAVALTSAQILFLAGPAAAHGGGESIADLSAADTVARAVAIAAAVLLAGAALLSPLTGLGTEVARRVLATATAAGAVAIGLGMTGGLATERYLTLLPLLLLAGALAIFGPARLGPVGGFPVIGWLCWDALRDDLSSAALMVGHVGVAAVWTGAVLASATAAAGTRSALVRRLGPIAVGAAALAAVTGVLSARSYDVTLNGITVTSFGSMVVFKSVLLLAVATLGLSVRLLLRRSARDRPRAGAGLARAELVVVLGAVIAGAVLTTLPAPGPPPPTGAPLARALTFDEDTTGLLIAPQRPGLNLVHLMTDNLTDVVVDGRTYRAAPRPGSQGMWAEVQLPAGRSLLEVRQGRRVVGQVVDTGSGPDQAVLAGPDGAECASAALGAAVGGSRAPLGACPSAALSAADATSLRGMIDALAERKATAVRLLTDATARGVAAEREVRAVAGRLGLRVVELAPGAQPRGAGDVLVAVAGWEVTRAGLAALAGTPHLYGTYLAPWLMTAPVVVATGSAPLAALSFDPAGPEAQAYISALRRVGPTESASSSGFTAFLAARGLALPDRDALLYASTSGFEVMPMNGGDGEGMDHGIDLTWLGGGALTPVSGRLTGADAG